MYSHKRRTLHLDANRSTDIPPVIFLVGPMGSGKTTLGKRLANNNRGYKFIDQDDFIEQQQQMSISDIFAQYGEEHFRNLESQFIENFKGNEKVIIATGGGVVLRPENILQMKKIGTVIYLKLHFLRQYDRLLNCTKRPLAQDKDNLLRNLSQMSELRTTLYEKSAHITIDANKFSSALSATIQINKMLRMYHYKNTKV